MCIAQGAGASVQLSFVFILRAPLHQTAALGFGVARQSCQGQTRCALSAWTQRRGGSVRTALAAAALGIVPGDAKLRTG